MAEGNGGNESSKSSSAKVGSSRFPIQFPPLDTPQKLAQEESKESLYNDYASYMGKYAPPSESVSSRARYGGWPTVGCSCGEETLRPLLPNELISVTHRFYEAETLLAYMDTLGFDPAGYDGSAISMVEGSLREDTKNLFRVWQIYLARAIAGESRYINRGYRRCHTRTWHEQKTRWRSIDGYRSAQTDWISNVKISPCPVCEPFEALAFFRELYDMFMCQGIWGATHSASGSPLVDCKGKPNGQAYGGELWAKITAHLVASLHFRGSRLELGDGSKWDVEEARWLSKQPGTPFALRRRLLDRLGGMPGPIPDERCDANIFRNKAIWVDHCVDLEHNTGCVLGKGYIHADRYSFDQLLRFKHKGNMLNVPTFFRSVTARVRARLGLGSHRKFYAKATLNRIYGDIP